MYFVVYMCPHKLELLLLIVTVVLEVLFTRSATWLRRPSALWWQKRKWPTLY